MKGDSMPKRDEVAGGKRITKGADWERAEDWLSEMLPEGMTEVSQEEWLEAVDNVANSPGILQAILKEVRDGD